jgi:hypothetical protein
MIEQQNINGRDVLLRVEPLRPERENENIIPREYFTVSYYLEQGGSEENGGEVINDEDGSPKLFESPVAALSFARKKLEGVL